MNTLPLGWIYSTLEQVCVYIQRGKSPKYAPVSDLPVINQKCIRWEGIEEQHLKFVDPSQASAWGPERYLCSGDILWNSTGTGTIGRASLFGGSRTYPRMVADSHVTVVRPSNHVEGRFIHALISSPIVQSKIEDMQSGSTNQVELSREQVLSTLVPLPPQEEQRRIISKIGSLSTKSKRARDHLEHVQRLVERYRILVLGAAFRGDLASAWRAVHALSRPPMKPLGEVVSEIRYGTAQKCEVTANGIAVLRIPNVSSGSISLSGLKYAQLDAREYKKIRLEEGDVLVIRSNGSADLLGRAALVPSQASGMAYAGYLIRLRADRSIIDPKFMNFMLGAPQIREIIEVSARSTSGIHNINTVELASLMLPVPTLSEQRETVRRIEAAFDWIGRLDTEASSARKLIDRLDQAVLSKAFRGELVPQDPDDEAASVLLERIKAERAGSTPARSGRGRPRLATAT
ncbi:restriction endonuclease subunit S [Methylobacterium sp. XJLW]|uniref:restriction endonuclease subunit S n=1 Tax=Methylobacterium sp. XJLW TaxID=739141 RepID=UPI000DAE2D45|nr:restriction endonuclease subunit S [Methylobacterium sp. XJLW]